MDTLAGHIGNVIGLMPLLVCTFWVYLDAKAIGDDRGQAPGIVDTKPARWATWVFLFLIIALPIYLLRRVHYKRLLLERKAALLSQQNLDEAVDMPGVWPPPPTRPIS